MSASPDSAKAIRTLQQVWDLVSLKLKEARAMLHKANDALYGMNDRIAYMDRVQEALKLICARKVATVESYKELNALLDKVVNDDCSSYSQVRDDAVETLQDFHKRCMSVLEKVQQVNTLINVDILSYLHQYCSDYRKLGIPEDKFDESLQSRTAVVSNYIERFEELVGFLNEGTPIPQDLFGYSFFSQELAIELDCDCYPILRVIPDLIQKLEMSCDITSDWLRGDKLYVQELEKQIENFRTKVQDSEKAAEMSKLKYDRLFTQLKSKQAALNEEEDNFGDLKREVKAMEQKKGQIEKELRDQAEEEAKLSRQVSTVSEVSESEYEGELNVNYGFLHTSYAARTNLHSRSKSAKMDALRQQRKAIGEAIQDKKAQLEEFEELEQGILLLSKKLRVAGRQKVKIVEQMNWAKGQMDKMVIFMKTKMYPEAIEREKVKEKHKTRAARKNRQFKRMHSLELDTAFRLVRNNIGHGWKDLARALPYSPAKGVHEINNEIDAIEYENQGHLKEQAYQTLVHWSSHNGRRASIEKLQDTLRDLQQNRLADAIEKKVLGSVDDEAESEAPTPQIEAGEAGFFSKK